MQMAKAPLLEGAAPVSPWRSRAAAAACFVLLAGVAVLSSGGGQSLEPRSSLRPAAVAAAAPVALVAPVDLAKVSTGTVPRAKQIFEKFDRNFHHQGDDAGLAWNDKEAWMKTMAGFFTANFTYDFVYPFGKTYGISDWLDGEHTAYNTAFTGYNASVFLSIGSEDAVSPAAFHLATWTGPWAGVPAPSPPVVVHVKDLDFYAYDAQGLVPYNWCLVDVLDILRQGGHVLLPPTGLEDDGLYPAPRAVDGLPAPNSLYVREELHAMRPRFEALLRRSITEDYITQQPHALAFAANAPWYGPGGIGRAADRAEYVKYFLAPLHAAFSNPVLQLDMLLCEGSYCGAHFLVKMKHTGTWLGAAATGREVTLRVGMHARIATQHSDLRACPDPKEPCIAEAWAQMDIPRTFADMGIDLLAPARA
jgi:hypothetical protein